MSINEWSGAFLLTQLIELPIYLRSARSLPALQRMAYAFGASTITHPVIWFCLPWEGAPYVALLIAAECFAIGAEGAWGGCWRVPRPWRASLLANAASLTAGMLIRWVYLA
ncbi:MAG: hypothetical protein WAW39_16965 [Prosthecobacter sp.]|uniref:hypothetical protein n=1 Tax=Prosthecobacter sp. TaxID=1965333 RepID=UPI003BB0D731